ATYLGGRGDEFAGGIAVDRFGRAYVTGTTWSPDFPTVNAMQSSPGGHAAFRTIDGGTTWTGIQGGLQTAAVMTFAIDPVHTSTIYAGTSSDSVFKSNDGGSTWARTATDLPAMQVNAMAVGADGVVYVANDAGLYRTDDQGA